MQFQIISDGSCDLTMELREKYNIQVIPFYVSFDGENYRRRLMRSVSAMSMSVW